MDGHRKSLRLVVPNKWTAETRGPQIIATYSIAPEKSRNFITFATAVTCIYIYIYIYISLNFCKVA